MIKYKKNIFNIRGQSVCGQIVLVFHNRITVASQIDGQTLAMHDFSNFRLKNRKKYIFIKYNFIQNPIPLTENCAQVNAEYPPPCNRTKTGPFSSGSLVM